MNKILSLLAVICVLSACSNQNITYSSYQPVTNGWGGGEELAFDFKAPDSTSAYNVFIHLRNNEDYPFSNLFLIVTMEFPAGEVIKDTLEYEMAMPDGTWLGKGFSDLKENKLWYRENVKFPDTGTYTLKVQHAMRKNGNEEGVTSLQGITDVGISVELNQ